MLFWITVYGEYPGKESQEIPEVYGSGSAFAFRKSYTFLDSFQQVFKSWQSQKLMSHRPPLLGPNFSPTKADKKKKCICENINKIFICSWMRFLKDKYFYWKMKAYLFFVERSWKSKVLYLKSILSIVSLKFLAFKKRKKKSQFTLFCFIHRTVLCPSHSVQFRITWLICTKG